MSKAFHENKFDESTQLKLAIFRRYTREWISVFLTEWRKGNNYTVVNLFDFFAGPGTDKTGNPGSPRLIQDELKEYCRTRGDIKANGVQVSLYFNDKRKKHIDRLKVCLAENACSKDCCRREFSSKPFQEAFWERLPLMQGPQVANLVIMDQFGVTKVTPEVLRALVGCHATDVLFFISSSYIRRFSKVMAIREQFSANAVELVASDYKSIHRHICDHFRSILPSKQEYHLAPFSIKKGSNIYGVIFGSRSLYGLLKFLGVCWNLDPATGEANYDIDDDPVRFGQKSFLPEMNVVKKQDAFQQELVQRLQANAQVPGKSGPTNNLDIFRFTLENGFLPEHANAQLKELQRSGRLVVADPNCGKPVRKGAFYLTWEHYRQRTVKAVFRLKG